MQGVCDWFLPWNCSLKNDVENKLRKSSDGCYRGSKKASAPQQWTISVTRMSFTQHPHSKVPPESLRAPCSCSSSDSLGRPWWEGGQGFSCSSSSELSRLKFEDDIVACFAERVSSAVALLCVCFGSFLVVFGLCLLVCCCAVGLFVKAVVRDVWCYQGAMVVSVCQVDHLLPHLAKHSRCLLMAYCIVDLKHVSISDLCFSWKVCKAVEALFSLFFDCRFIVQCNPRCQL
jgi:hypothetical protein